MKILVLCQEFPPVGGGGGLAAFKISRELARSQQVDVITQHAKGLKKIEFVAGVRIFRVNSLGRKNLNSAPARSELVYPLSGFLTGCRLNIRSYDIVNAHFAVPTGPLGFALSRLTNSPLVLSVHGSDIYNKWRSWGPQRNCFVRNVVSWVLHKADFIVPQSSDLRQKVLHYYGQELAVKLEAVPLPFDMCDVPDISDDKKALRQRLGIEPEATHVVSIGRFVERKGFDKLVSAMAYLPENIHLILIGEGPMRSVIDQIIQKEGLAGRVVLPGRIEGPAKYQYLAAGDIFVLPSLYEAFGIVLQETMAVGLPVIYSDNGGQKDLMINGKTGICVKKVDPESIAKAVRKLAEKPSLRQKMGQRNKKRLMIYNPAAIALKYLDVFQKAIDNYKRL